VHSLKASRCVRLLCRRCVRSRGLWQTTSDEKLDAQPPRLFTSTTMDGDTNEYKSDVSRPSALPTARLRAAQSSSATAADSEQSSEQYLDAAEEEWNRKIDAELDVLVEGMQDLVALAEVIFCFYILQNKY
jgi:hypothetical protein